jgi:hypothetical protein
MFLISGVVIVSIIALVVAGFFATQIKNADKGTFAMQEVASAIGRVLRPLSGVSTPRLQSLRLLLRLSCSLPSLLLVSLTKDGTLLLLFS